MLLLLRSIKIYSAERPSGEYILMMSEAYLNYTVNI